MKKLFIDDIRRPEDVYNYPNSVGWVVARSYDETIRLIETHGIPEIISFDHDLGTEKTGYDIAKYLIDKIFIDQLALPDNFTYFIHSANPVGRQNIQQLLDRYIPYPFLSVGCGRIAD